MTITPGTGESPRSPFPTRDALLFAIPAHILAQTPLFFFSFPLISPRYHHECHKGAVSKDL